MQSAPTIHQVGIIMNGVTGRMGTNQHLIRSICAIRKQGGVKISDGEFIMPDPILVGRNVSKLRRSPRPTASNASPPISTPRSPIRSTPCISTRRPPAAAPTPSRKPSPPASTFTAKSRPPFPPRAAYELYEIAKKAGVKNGVVQDKLWLPGLVKLKTLIDSGFFGKILSVRGEFGYWVFEGDTPVLPQRPSWNYRKEDDGGIIVDMLCHWRYVLDNLFGEVKAVSLPGSDARHRTVRRTGQAVQVHRRRLGLRDLRAGRRRHRAHQFVVDRARAPGRSAHPPGGRHKGSAVAGLRDCVVQHQSATPRPTWNPDIDSPIKFFDGWNRVPDYQLFDNAFKIQWEMFLRHVVKDEPWRFSLLEGAKGVQLAEKGLESWAKRAWVDVPELKA